MTSQQDHSLGTLNTIGSENEANGLIDEHASAQPPHDSRTFEPSWLDREPE